MSCLLIQYSIVIPHYEDFFRLNRLLSSIPLHRLDVEAIVIDDQSPNRDELNKIQKKWPAVRFLYTQKNSGAGAARNYGLEASKGTWLIFADSDDEFLPGAFDVFDQHIHEDDSLIYFLAESIQEINGELSVRSKPMNRLVLAYEANPCDQTRRDLQLGHVVPWAKVYSRSAIERLKVKFDEVSHSNDIAFNVLTAIQLPMLRVVAKPVYRLYRREGSLTSKETTDSFMVRFMVNYSLAKRLERLGIKKARSATGQMLLSFKYGPKVVLHVWFLSIFSPMHVDWVKVFSINRWLAFFDGQSQSNKEKKRF